MKPFYVLGIDRKTYGETACALKRTHKQYLRAHRLGKFAKKTNNKH